MNRWICNGCTQPCIVLYESPATPEFCVGEHKVVKWKRDRKTHNISNCKSYVCQKCYDDCYCVNFGDVSFIEAPLECPLGVPSKSSWKPL